MFMYDNALAMAICQFRKSNRDAWSLTWLAKATMLPLLHFTASKSTKNGVHFLRDNGAYFG